MPKFKNSLSCLCHVMFLYMSIYLKPSKHNTRRGKLCQMDKRLKRGKQPKRHKTKHKHTHLILNP